MKYLILLFVMLSCANAPEKLKKEPVLIEISFYKNGIKVETGKIVANLNREAEIKKENKNKETTFRITPKRGQMKGVKGVLLKTNTIHISKKFGDIKLKNEFFLEMNKQARLDITDSGQKISITAVVRQVDISSDAKDKMCMGSFIE